MLVVFEVKRYDSSLTVVVGPRGMEFRLSHRFPSGKEKQKVWRLKEYPEAMVASAEFALGGYKGFHKHFLHDTFEGQFGARQNTKDFIDLHIIVDEIVGLVLRRTEVQKIVEVMWEYFEMGGEIAIAHLNDKTTLRCSEYHARYLLWAGKANSYERGGKIK